MDRCAGAGRDRCEGEEETDRLITAHAGQASDRGWIQAGMHARQQ